MSFIWKSLFHSKKYHLMVMMPMDGWSIEYPSKIGSDWSSRVEKNWRLIHHNFQTKLFCDYEIPMIWYKYAHCLGAFAFFHSDRRDFIMQVFVRGASELIPLDLENDDTVEDIRVSSTIDSRLWRRSSRSFRNTSLKNVTLRSMISFSVTMAPHWMMNKQWNNSV